VENTLYFQLFLLGGIKKGAPSCETCGEPGTDGNPLLDVADEQGFTKLHRSCSRAWISHQQAAE